MQIRPMTFRDIPSLAPLLEQFWDPPEPQNVNRMESVFRRVEHDDAYIMLVAYDGKLLGTVTGIVCQEVYGDGHPFMLVENMIVDLDNRGKGVGAALFRELEKRARDKGCRQMILVTEADRNDAKAFYGAMGFNPNSNAGFKKKLW